MASSSSNRSFNMLAGIPPHVTPAPDPIKPAFRRPRHVPDWVWAQYLVALQQDRYSDPSDRANAYWRNLDHLILKAKPEVWDSIYKFRLSADKIWRQRVKDSGRGKIVIPRPAVVPALANTATAVLEGFKGYHLHTGKMRRRAGARVKKHANALSDELSTLIKGMERLPYSFGKQFESVGLQVPDIPMLVATLNALALGGTDWAQTSPILGQPNNENALRLAMLRIMRGHFDANFGRPMIIAVLGITSAFFNCDDLTVDAVSEITSAKRKKSAV